MPMPYFFRILAALSAGLLLVISDAGLADNQTSVSITEWTVPWENSRPRDPYVGAEGLVWFVGQKGDYVARLDPTTGDFKRYDLDSGTGPHTVIVDERGVWYAGNRARHLGLLNPDSGEITKIMMPGDGPGDVHTMDFTDAGDIWFTLQGANQIGFMAAGNREVTLHDVPTDYARPYGLLVADDNRPWATLFGSYKLARASREGGVTEIELPRENARPRRLALTEDGMVWYVDYAQGYLGRYNPGTGKFSEWRTPAKKNSRPYGMGADHKGRLWFVETGLSPNRLVGFDPETETFTEPVDIESGGGTIRRMHFDAERKALWFGTDTNTIGRALIE